MPSWVALGSGVLALLAALLLFPPDPLMAQDVSEKTGELKDLRAQIKLLQERLQANQREKSRAEERLQAVENQIGEIRRELRRIDAELEAKHEQREELRQQQRRQSESLQQQRERLASEARTAYAMGRQQQVKLLLNQERPSAVGRMLVYFGYLSRARINQIEAVSATLRQFDALEESIEQKTQVLAQLRNTHQAESHRLQERKQARKQAVAALSQELKNQGGELKRLRADERRLQELVTSLQDVLVDIPVDAPRQHHFKSLKGKLPWPTRGQLVKRFGSQRGSGGLTWRGVVIAAPEGGDVRAVLQGRVAFSDWMRGFGLLVILDHGDGYMSLYGHNQALYKEVGEWVDSGEVVATLGASGGQSETGLYFELRHEGRPIDPSRWCAGSPPSKPG